VTYINSDIGISNTNLVLIGERAEPITIYWNIRIDNPDEWWKICSDSPKRDSLDFGEEQFVWVQVHREDKAPGQYQGSLTVESYGKNYLFNKEIIIFMEIGAGDFQQRIEPGPDSRDEIDCDPLTTGSLDLTKADNSFGQHLNADSVVTDSLTFSDASGFYEIIYLQQDRTYTVKPIKTDEITAATITMYDAALAARLAKKALPDTCEARRAAADVDQDSLVTMTDAALIARHAIGLPPDPNSQVGQWAFLPATRDYPKIGLSYIGEDFTALVKGDVDASWLPADSVQAQPLTKNLNDYFAEQFWINGNQLVIPLNNPTGSEIFAFEIDLNFSPHFLEFDRFQSMTLNPDFKILTRHCAEKGRLKVGGYSVQPVKKAGPFARIIFNTKSTTGLKEEIQVTRYQINGCDLEPDKLSGDTGQEVTRSLDQPVLNQNYPNPFNPETIIHYQLTHSRPERTVIQIFNLQGQLVKILVDQFQSAGTFQIIWPGDDWSGQPVTSGIYLVRLSVGNQVRQQRKIVKVK